ASPTPRISPVASTRGKKPAARCRPADDGGVLPLPRIGISNFSPWHDHGLALILRAIGADPEHIRHDLLRKCLGGGALRDEAALRQHQNAIGKSRGGTELRRDPDPQR